MSFQDLVFLYVCFYCYELDGLLRPWYELDEGDFIRSKLCSLLTYQTGREVLALSILGLQAVWTLKGLDEEDQIDTASLDDLQQLIDDPEIVQDSIHLLDCLIGSFYKASCFRFTSSDPVIKFFEIRRLPQESSATEELKEYFIARSHGQDHAEAKTGVQSEERSQKIHHVNFGSIKWITRDRVGSRDSSNGNSEEVGKHECDKQDIQGAVQRLRIQE